MNMNAHLAQQILWEELTRHWVSALLLSLTVLTIVVLLGARWWWRKRWRRIIDQGFPWESDLDVLPPLGPVDLQALELIRELRHEVWAIPEAELELSVEALSRRAIRVVRSVAAVYFPSAEVPEYEASLVESLQLIRRVSGKLIRLAAVTPFRLLGNRKLSEYQRFYQVYRKINDNPILQALKRHKHIYKIARWAVNLKNIGNPFYWAGKEVSKEGYFFMIRWFYMALTSQVGKEAMRLYSGRRFHREEDRDAVLICHRLFALTRQWDGPSPDEWATLVDFLINQPSLEPEVKLNLLSKWSHGRIPEKVDEQPLQTEAGVKWYRRGLKRLSDAHPHSLSAKERTIREELEALESSSPAPPDETSQPPGLEEIVS